MSENSRSTKLRFLSQMFTPALYKFNYNECLYMCTVDNPMFHTKYPIMHNMKMHAAAIRTLLYGVHVCTGDNTPTKYLGYLPLHVHTYA